MYFMNTGMASEPYLSLNGCAHLQVSGVMCGGCVCGFVCGCVFHFSSLKNMPE